MQYILITYYSPLPIPPLTSPFPMHPISHSFSPLKNTSKNGNNKKDKGKN